MDGALKQRELSLPPSLRPESVLIIRMRTCPRRRNISIYLKSHPFESNYRDEIKMSTELRARACMRAYACSRKLRSSRMFVFCDRPRAIYLQI